MRSRLFGSIIAGAVALALSSVAAFAQSGAACLIDQSRVNVQGTGIVAYTLGPSDNCTMIVFTNAVGVALTIPNPPGTGGVPPGFSVWIKDQGAGSVFTTPTTATLDGSGSAFTITQGTGVGLRTDGLNWYSTGLGLKRP